MKGTTARLHRASLGWFAAVSVMARAAVSVPPLEIGFAKPVARFPQFVDFPKEALSREGGALLFTADSCFRAWIGVTWSRDGEATASGPMAPDVEGRVLLLRS